MLRDIPTDKIVSLGLISALILSIVLNGGSELSTNIASGLIGYLSKGYLEHEDYVGKHYRKGGNGE